jgi:hypothetical protein
MNASNVTDFQAFSERYVELWNLGDDENRRETIRSLWADDGGHVAPTISVKGYEELEARVARSYQRWGVEERCRFRLRGNERHHNVARILWEMLDRDGKVESLGTEIIVLNEAGKIDCAYQFIDR